MIKITDIHGAREASTLLDLETCLMQRCDDHFNSFWLSHDDQEYPALAVVVEGEIASLSYFPKESSPGFTSVGGMAGLEDGDVTMFSISKNLGDDIGVLNRTLIPFSAALHVATEFFCTKGLPLSIKWEPH